MLLFGCILYSNAQIYSKSLNQTNPEVVQIFSDVFYGETNSPSYIHFSIYVTRELNVDDPAYAYKYQIMIVNHSLYARKLSSIYMSGMKTFANGVLISGAYPNGFWAIVQPEQPTSLYWYKTNASSLNFGISWENIVFY